jgi:DNA-binding response OmpR family regulator
MAARVQLNDEDVTLLLTLLRNATQPLTTQQLIDALRRSAGTGQSA